MNSKPWKRPRPAEARAASQTLPHIHIPKPCAPPRNARSPKRPQKLWAHIICNVFPCFALRQHGPKAFRSAPDLLRHAPRAEPRRIYIPPSLARRPGTRAVQNGRKSFGPIALVHNPFETPFIERPGVEDAQRVARLRRIGASSTRKV